MFISEISYILGQVVMDVPPTEGPDNTTRLIILTQHSIDQRQNKLIQDVTRVVGRVVAP